MPIAITQEEFWRRVDRSGECWEWQGPRDRQGYGRISTRRAHRIAWEYTNGPIPDGMEVLHTCDNRRCVRNDEPGVYVVNGIECPRLGHLFLGTPKDNSADMIAKGRDRVFRERNAAAKLTEATVAEIRALYDGRKGSQAALARQFGLSASHIYYILKGRLWSLDTPNMPQRIKQFTDRDAGTVQ